MRGEWIEIFNTICHYITPMSLPMRGEWIEIFAISGECG